MNTIISFRFFLLFHPTFISLIQTIILVVAICVSDSRFCFLTSQSILRSASWIIISHSQVPLTQNSTVSHYLFLSFFLNHKNNTVPNSNNIEVYQGKYLISIYYHLSFHLSSNQRMDLLRFFLLVFLNFKIFINIIHAYKNKNYVNNNRRNLTMKTTVSCPLLHTRKPCWIKVTR